MKSVREIVTEASAEIESVTPKQASDELASGDAILIDVREPTEWEHHIAGAFQVPRGLLEFVADSECGPLLPPSLKFDWDLGRKVIVYCSSGARGTLATLTLKNMGLDAANLDGGLVGWKEAGLPTVEHYSGI
jgi:rhodanese-related sulfurtransferase